jgi:predicted Zn-dependent protease
MNRIIEKIRQHGFDDYKIIQVKSTENQLYLLRDRIESTRTVASNHYQITVYLDHHESQRKLRGEYKFEYKPGSDLRFYLEQAKSACSLIMNRHYDLVGSTTSSDVQALDVRLNDPLQLGKQLADTIYKNTNEDNVYLSSAEIYLTRSEITLTTSTGIEISKVKGLIEIETTLVSKKGSEEQELNFELKRRNVDDLRLQQRLDEYKEHALNMLNVQVPRSGKANVVINASDVYDLFAPVIFHSSGQAKDQGISRFNIDRKIVENATNEFTLKSSGILPFGLFTEPFDADGIACQEHTLIDRGIFRKYWTTKRYADYLGVEPTGEFKNLIIEPATKSALDFDSYYEIVQFSDLSPDPITGDIVAEIRFGYGVSNGQKIPVKGGSVGGNIFENLKHVYFVDDSVFEGLYSGPRFIVLKDMSISGQ